MENLARMSGGNFVVEHVLDYKDISIDDLMALRSTGHLFKKIIDSHPWIGHLRGLDLSPDARRLLLEKNWQLVDLGPYLRSQYDPTPIRFSRPSETFGKYLGDVQSAVLLKNFVAMHHSKGVVRFHKLDGKLKWEHASKRGLAFHQILRSGTDQLLAVSGAPIDYEQRPFVWKGPITLWELRSDRKKREIGSLVPSGEQYHLSNLCRVSNRIAIWAARVLTVINLETGATVATFHQAPKRRFFLTPYRLWSVSNRGCRGRPLVAEIEEIHKGASSFQIDPLGRATYRNGPNLDRVTWVRGVCTQEPHQLLKLGTSLPYLSGTALISQNLEIGYYQQPGDKYVELLIPHPRNRGRVHYCPKAMDSRILVYWCSRWNLARRLQSHRIVLSKFNVDRDPIEELIELEREHFTSR